MAPFHHAFIEDIFPTELYGAVRDHMLRFKHSDEVQDRQQDNPNFMALPGFKWAKEPDRVSHSGSRWR